MVTNLNWIYRRAIEANITPKGHKLRKCGLYYQLSSAS